MHFTCGVCQEDFRPLRSTQIILPNGDDCCYPFEWGSTPLYFQDYQRWIPAAEFAALMAAYEAKEEELKTLPEDRVYCDRDGTFLGAKGILVDSQASGRYYCECGRKMCAECGSNAEAAHQVGCAHRSGKEDPFEGLKKGVDVQFCPSCNTAFALADGCNSVQCANCRVEFCFLCGAGPVAHGDKTHWQRGEGKCPRFGRADAENPIFDDQVQIVDGPPPPPPEAAWAALYRERVAHARNFLFALRGHMLGFQDLLPEGQTLDDEQQSALQLVRDLHKVYGIFDLAERGEAIPVEGFDPLEAEVQRHRRIVRFRETPGAPHSFERLHGLWQIYSWYLSHYLIIAKVVGPNELQVRRIRGNPEVEDAIPPEEWNEALEGATEEELRLLGGMGMEMELDEAQAAQDAQGEAPVLQGEAQADPGEPHAQVG